MGTAFVLLVWSTPFILIALAFVTMRVAGLIVRRRGRDAGLDKLTMINAILAPPITMIVAGVACFVAYAAWCTTVRHVDWGIGDDFRLPLGGGYSMLMIDTPDRAGIYKGYGDGEPLVGGVRDVSIDGDRVTGVTVAGDAFALNTSSDALTHYDSRDALLRAVTPAPSLQPVTAVYYRLRWNWTDVAAALLAIALEIWIAWRSLRKVRTTVLVPTPAPLRSTRP